MIQTPDTVGIHEFADPVIIPFDIDNPVRVPQIKGVIRDAGQGNQAHDNRQRSTFENKAKQEPEQHKDHQHPEKIISGEQPRPCHNGKGKGDGPQRVTPVQMEFLLRDDQGHGYHHKPGQIFDERKRDERDHPCRQKPSREPSQRKNDVKRSEAPGRLRPGREQPFLAIHAQDKLDTAQQDQGDCGREGPLLNEKKQKRGGPQ